jgi:hypothetical protein|tara:strand:+ start:295 stop:438 length:144 start_codon:yes stop_codon:yes gene_type:complete
MIIEIAAGILMTMIMSGVLILLVKLVIDTRKTMKRQKSEKDDSNKNL